MKLQGGKPEFFVLKGAFVAPVDFYTLPLEGKRSRTNVLDGSILFCSQHPTFTGRVLVEKPERSEKFWKVQKILEHFFPVPPDQKLLRKEFLREYFAQFCGDFLTPKSSEKGIF